ncbi:non-ribosomal peptide synthetase [Streptomyces sp. NBC_01236]|uniref:non-ribosomal peptide synthetase n=1 Tax=Streptomyces sp. NBC_01236 TaxID=2903789 RepID=UPI002E15FDC9|nr:amino acid adenylation domain-containing protein [Streptomyces sp. NBC_01236]
MQKPAIPGQLRFFTLDLQKPRPAIVHRLTATGPVDGDRLLAAVRAVLRAQPALRLSLHPEPAGLMQRVHPVADVPVEVHRLPADAASAGRLLRERVDALGDPFDHAGAPLCRVSVLLGDDRAQLLFGVHHGIFDDGSAAALLDALTTAYAQGPDALPDAGELPPPPQGEQAAALREFWTRTLKEAPADCTLPQLVPGADRTRGSVTAQLPAALVARMRDRARETGASVFTQVMASLAWVAGWYARTDDVVIATASGAGRDTSGASVINCLQNTIPVRVPLSGATTEQLLDRTLEALFDAVEHSELPLEEILAATGAERHPDRKPFTQLMCTQGELFTEAEGGGLLWRMDPPESDQVEYDLSVTLLHGPQGEEHLVVAHPAQALDGRTAERFLAHLVAALDALTAPHSVPLTGHDLLTAEERAELAALTGAPVPGTPAPVHRLVEEQALRTPHATALVTSAELLDHAALHARAERLAAALIAAGVRPGDRVGVCLERSAGLVVAVLAAWRAGAAYVPLDPDYPGDRLHYMLEDSAPAAVIAESPLLPGVPTLAPDAEAPLPAAWPQVPADSPAYVMYTSGSTGRPKGTVVRHDNLWALFAGFDSVLDAIPDVVLAGTSLSFDICLIELFWSLTRGCAVHLTSHRTVLDEEGVPDGAFYQCTPSAARLHTSSPEGRRLLGRLGALVVAGEPLDADLAAELAGLVPGPVVNGYGPTEATVYTTLWRVRPDTPVHIGLPLPGVRCHVVDAHGRAMPPGCPGDLVITGTGIGGGYWRRPELTAERFPALPWAGGGTGYLSGDVVSFAPGTGLRFLHRADQQIKVLGQRIETGEIEATLRLHPGVRDAAVAVLPDRTGVAAFLVPEEGAADLVPQGDAAAGALPVPLSAATAAGLRRHAAGWLTGAMLPTVWQTVAVLPKSPNGKLDRLTLADWAARSAPAAPRTGTEELSGSATSVVLEVWEQVLGERVTDPGATFFHLGGTSAGIIRVLALLQPRYPDLRAAGLFRHTTARALAAHLTDLTDLTRTDAREEPAETADAVPAARTDGSGRGARRAQALGQWTPRARR